MPQTDWNPLLRGEFDKPYWQPLQQFVADERQQAQVFPPQDQVFPPQDQVFAALHLTAYAQVKVVILGQDPYHQPGQAHGLCFSVADGVRPPPSLKNIFQELASDLGAVDGGAPDSGAAGGAGAAGAPETGTAAPAPNSQRSGNLQAWATQGVLLLNSVLTVRASQAGSHRGKGWEHFTDEVIRVVSAKPEPVVFILWGAFARSKAQLVDTSRHEVIESAHPSPLSASGGFFGSRPFSRANDALIAAGRDPVDWRLP